MKSPSQVQFDLFRFDSTDARLWRGEEAIPLTPRAFALLGYLVGRGGQLLTKEELLQAVWEDTLVSDAALAVCIREIRKALGDQARHPRFIETVHRRGYRFIAPVEMLELPNTPMAAPTSGEAASRNAPIAEPGAGGRTAELGKLHAALDGVRSAIDGLTNALEEIERTPTPEPVPVGMEPNRGSWKLALLADHVRRSGPRSRAI